jgi:hypothetical protein
VSTVGLSGCQEFKHGAMSPQRLSFHHDLAFNFV